LNAAGLPPFEPTNFPGLPGFTNGHHPFHQSIRFSLQA
jgi:hypothetical protein